MSALDARTVAPDPTAVRALTEAGLDYRRIALDGAGFDGFLRAVSSGFLGEHPTPERIEYSRTALSRRRLLGVFDGDSVQQQVPVGTIDSWVTELTVEPGTTVPMWSISAVTVAPTHRRRGIARAMVEGELRTAAAAGVAIAGLTVSEATIYGRFGFSPAVFNADWTITTSRARWVGPRPAGRLDTVDRETLCADLEMLHDRVRMQSPGEVEGWPGLWKRTTGLAPGVDGAGRIRGLRWTDPSGEIRGSVAYSLSASGDFTEHELQVLHFVADGDDAAAALWCCLLEHDLVRTVKASLLPTADPLRWMIADQRGVVVSETDHHWLRILDVPAALTSRTFRRPGEVVLRVQDPLGFADGTWQLTVDDDGHPTVTPTEAAPTVTLSVGALSSLLLGGVRAGTLRSAGLLQSAAADVPWLDATFAPLATPRLSLWY